MKKVMLVVVCLCFMMAGCATVNGTAQFDKEKVNTAISVVQGLETAIQWIAPVACGFVSIAQPAAGPACQMAVVSAQALKVVTDQAVAAYNQDPSATNAQAIFDMQGKLKAAWDQLDGAYKGDSSKL